LSQQSSTKDLMLIMNDSSGLMERLQTPSIVLAAALWRETALMHKHSHAF
jgi:hypothetical protein